MDTRSADAKTPAGGRSSNRKYDRRLFGPLPEWSIFVICGGAMLLLIIGVVIFFIVRNRKLRKSQNPMKSVVPKVGKVYDQRMPPAPVMQMGKKEDAVSLHTAKSDDGMSVSASLPSESEPKKRPLSKAASLTMFATTILSTELPTMRSTTKGTGDAISSLPNTSASRSTKRGSLRSITMEETSVIKSVTVNVQSE